MDLSIHPRRAHVRAALALVWALALASPNAQAQIVQPAHKAEIRQAPQARTENDFARLRAAPEMEVQRLEKEREALCRPSPAAAACKQKTEELSKARLALPERLQSISRHEADARKGVLVPRPMPGGPPPHVAGGCGGCHTAPSAAPTQDPLPAPRPTPPKPTGNSTSSDAVPSTKPPSVSRTNDPMPSARTTGSATGCFIATAAYGTAQAPQVETLRRFRDRWLVGHPLGDRFVAAYYRWSPPLADAIAERSWARQLVRLLLWPLVGALEWPALALAVCAAAVAGMVRRSRRRGSSRYARQQGGLAVDPVPR